MKKTLLTLCFLFAALSGYAQEVTLTAIDPADGSEMAELTKGNYITFTFSDPDAVNYLLWRLVDNNPTNPDEAILNTGYKSAKEADGTWKCKLYATFTLYQGHTYSVEVYPYAKEEDTHGDTSYANAIAKCTATYTGTAKAYEYSSVTLESLNPAEGATIVNAGMGEIMAIFSDKVSITANINNGQAGDNTPCEVRDENGDGTVWTIIIPESTLNSARGNINVNCYAKDAEGKAVNAGDGLKDDSHFVWSYACYMGSPKFDVSPASGSTLQQLDTLVVSYSGGLNFSYLCSNKIQVWKDKEYVCDIPEANITRVSEDDYKTMQVILPEAQTEAGNYQVIFPTLYFSLGEEFEAYFNNEQIVEYTIEGEAKKGGIEVTPAAGKVTMLNEFTFTYTDGGMLVPCADSAFDLHITNEKGESVATISQDDLNAGVMTEGSGWDAIPVGSTVKLKDPITAPGTYTLTIPAGAFYVGESYENCEETTLVYTIESSDPSAGIVFTSDPSDGSTVSSINLITFTFTNNTSVDFGVGNPTITDANGSAIAGNVMMIYGSGLNQMIVRAATPVTTPGTYTVTLPAGSLILDNALTTEDVTIHLTVSDDTPTGIVFTADPADGSTVESISKITFTFTNNHQADYHQANAATITDANGSSATEKTALSWGLGLNQLILECTPITADGVYTITLPAGCIALDNVETTEDVVMTLTIGSAVGVKNINIAAGNKIYNIAGQRVSKMQKGINIVNGKKVLK